MGTLYETDIVAWAEEQAKLLRKRDWSALDIDNIAGEIEDVGINVKHALGSRFAVLIAHLLKWQFQPERRGKSWRSTIDVQRRTIARRLQLTPSLKHLMSDPDWVAEIWEDGFVLANSETGISDLPQTPIWTLDEVLDSHFFPE